MKDLLFSKWRGLWRQVPRSTLTTQSMMNRDKTILAEVSLKTMKRIEVRLIHRPVYAMSNSSLEQGLRQTRWAILIRSAAVENTLFILQGMVPFFLMVRENSLLQDMEVSEV